MNILFMCVHNSARSQMAEALAREIIPAANVQSAGSNPSGRVHPAVFEVLKAIDVDSNLLKSKSMDDLPKEFLDKLDLIITLCADEICPSMVTQAKILHWPMPDPSKENNHDLVFLAFAEVRDQIKEKIEKLKEEDGL